MTDTRGFTGEHRMLIDGELVEAESGRRFDNINPATGRGTRRRGGCFACRHETRDHRRAIGINGGLWYGADSPYGGYKSSGIGRQNGIEGFEQHLETKPVAWLRES